MISATTNTIRKMKNRTCAMPAAVDATPPKPRSPAITAITSNTRAQYSIALSVAAARATASSFHTCVRAQEQAGRPPGSGGQGAHHAVEAEADPGTDVVDALVLLRQTGVRDVVDKGRDLDLRVDPVTDFELLAEQDVRAKALAV